MPVKTSPILNFKQSSFIGGMHRHLDPIQIGDNEYSILSNARSRYGILQPVKLPLQYTQGLPTGGLIQGVYTARSIMVVFVNGDAYYRDFKSGPNIFSKISTFPTMS